MPTAQRPLKRTTTSSALKRELISLKMARFTPPRREISQASDKKQSASMSSMERALRALTPTSSPIPHTPRRIDGCGAEMRGSSTSVSRRIEELSDDKSRRSEEAIKDAVREWSNNNNGSEEAVKVAVRVRPLASRGAQCSGRAWKISSERNAIVEIIDARNDQSYAKPNKAPRGSGDLEFVYDKVFGEDANTCEVYDALVSDLVESLTEKGINGTIFTYGQTCSGKTFTMQGSDSNESCTGIVQMAAKDIFQFIKDDDTISECSVRVSYVEIYNEELRDLLNDNNRKSSGSLTIREDKLGSISVEGLKEVAVKSLDQLMKVFRVGERNKAVGSTKMNERSSRSHAILKIMLEKRTSLNATFSAEGKENLAALNSPSNDLVVKTTAVLNLVDLAGSESVRHTGASGMQKKEGGMINQSLLTLSKVLMSLGQKNPGHVNYRDSKLTRILKPSLCGNARMAVICCISPSSNYIEETRSTLQFATRAKLVKTNATRHDEVEDANLIAMLRLENVRAMCENKKLADQLRNMEKVNRNALVTERELANLKKLVFSEKFTSVSESRVNQRLSLAPLSLADDRHSVSVGVKSKDDSCILAKSTREDELYTSSCSSNFLRDALGLKAKQVKNLQARINWLHEGEGTKATKDMRHSLISEARKIDLIDDARSPRKCEKERKDFYSQADIVQLKSKLDSANNIIESLERQIDDLSVQKNDALDWIEELFAKSDEKDEKIRHVNKVMNNASQKCEQLERDLLKVNELLQLSDEKLRQNLENSDFKISLMEAKIESAQDMFNQANTEKMQLLQDLRNANIKLSELESENARLKLANEGDPERDFEQASDLVKANAELARRLRELQAYSNAYAEEKQSLIEQIEKYEVDLTKVEALLKSKSGELDNAMFSLKKERESWQNEKKNLVKETNGAGQSSLSAGYQKDIVPLIKVNESLCNKMTNESKNATQKLQYAPENRVKVNELTQENKKLSAENLRLVNDNNKCMLRIGELSDHLVSARQQLKKMSDLSCELMSTQQQLQDSMNGTKSAHGKWVRSESEKSELCDRLNDANAKIKELNGRISVTSTELKIQENVKAQLQSSFSRVQQLVDALSSENSDMKKQNESLEMSRAYLKKRSHELQHLLSAASIDRDNLLESNTNLSSMVDMLSHERDEAVHEKERFKENLDRVAADFEADYQTVRSKIDNLLEEKKRLEDKIIFLEASKASVENNADRILQRDNTLAREHDRLKAEYKKQTVMIADLRIIADHLGHRLERVESENDRLTRDTRALKEITNRHEARPFDESNDKRKVFGFRANKNKDGDSKMTWGLS